MQFIIHHKKIIYIISGFFLFMILVILFVYIKYPKPLLKPKSILETRVISSENAKHTCKVAPFTQSINYLETKEFTVSLQPSKQNSYYFLEVGDVPPGLVTHWDTQEGKGNDTRRLQISSLNAVKTGSFTLTVAYHEWQGLNKWLVNYCLLNVVVPKQE